MVEQSKVKLKTKCTFLYKFYQISASTLTFRFNVYVIYTSGNSFHPCLVTMSTACIMKSVVSSSMKYDKLIRVNPGLKGYNKSIFVKWNKTELLTVILLEPKVICLCHQYRIRPAFTSIQSDQTQYCCLTNFKRQKWKVDRSI